MANYKKAANNLRLEDLGKSGIMKLVGKEFCLNCRTRLRLGKDEQGNRWIYCSKCPKRISAIGIPDFPLSQEEQRHPRFLWILRHEFQPKEGLPCTEKCLYCSEERHNPAEADIEKLGFVPDGEQTTSGNEYRQCKVCGKKESRRLVYCSFPGVAFHTGYGGTLFHTPWKEVDESGGDNGQK